jgi:Domain of unknown function (DUF4386)
VAVIERSAEPVPVAHRHGIARRRARLAGALYVPAFVLGPFSLLFVRDRLIAPGDAAGTANRIAGHEWLLRAGSAGELCLALIDVVLAVLLYLLLRPVHRPLALVAAAMRFAWAMIAIVAALTGIAALQILGHGDPSAFTVEQRSAAALSILEAHDSITAIGFVAFGCHLGIIGYLAWRFGVVPRPIGVLLVIAGAGYLANSLLVLFFAASRQVLLVLPAFPAELSLCLYLLVKGVRIPAAENA